MQNCEHNYYITSNSIFIFYIRSWFYLSFLLCWASRLIFGGWDCLPFQWKSCLRDAERHGSESKEVGREEGPLCTHRRAPWVVRQSWPNGPPGKELESNGRSWICSAERWYWENVLKQIVISLNWYLDNRIPKKLALESIKKRWKYRLLIFILLHRQWCTRAVPHPSSLRLFLFKYVWEAAFGYWQGRDGVIM